MLNDAEASIVDAVDFSGLRHAFRKLQKASRKLDTEKAAAEKKFRKLLAKLPPPPAHPGGPVARWARAVWHAVLRIVLGRKDPVREFIKAAKRVQRANAALVAFEKGFLHADGIKDREWYRHLAIAPGKWLGACFPLSRYRGCGLVLTTLGNDRVRCDAAAVDLRCARV